MHILGDEGLQNSATWVFHLAQKVGVISTGKCIAPWVSHYASFRAEFQCHVYSMNSSKYKESDTKEILKQLSATNISEQAKGKEKHFYYQKIFPHLWMHSHIRKWISESKFPHQAIKFSLFSFSVREMVQHRGKNILFLLHCFDRECLRRKEVGAILLLYWSLILQYLRWNSMTIHQKR